MTEELRELGADDLEVAWELGRLAFGGDPASSPTPPGPGRRTWGVLQQGRLLAVAAVDDYEQWWGGRRVPMAGVASVAVHPDARGQGAAARLVRSLLPRMAAAGQPVSALFPTAVGLYRGLGWEVVGSLDETRLPVRDLRGVGDPGDVRVRTAGLDDVPALRALWDEQGRAGAGALSRTGPRFPHGAQAALEADVVALAESGGQAVGYASYDRGRGYRAGAELHLWELVAGTPQATAALVRSLASWEAVVEAVRWRGPVEDLALLLRSAVPAPHEVQPWMLRVVDAPAAVAARGFPDGVEVDVGFALDDPDVPGHAGGWRLQVAGGSGALVREERAGGLPRLSVRGLALLFAGTADPGLLVRAGLLERPLPALAAAFAGPRPRLLDYF